MVKIKELKSNFSILGFSNILSYGISGIFWLYLASILTKEDYGEVGFLISIGATASAFAALGSSNSLVVLRAKNIQIQSTFFIIVILLSLVASIATYFIIGNYAISLYIIGGAIFSLSIYNLLGSKSYQKFAKYLVLQRILLVIFAITLYQILGIEGIILGYVASFVIFIKIIFKEMRCCKIDFSLFRNNFGFIIKNYISILVKVISANIDKLIIFPIFGATFLGTYLLAFQIFTLIMVIPTITYQYILPQEASGNKNSRIKKYTIIASILIVILTVIISPILIPITHPNYIESIPAIQIMSIAIIPNAISLIWISELLGKKETKTVLIGSLITSGVLSLGIIILGKEFQIMGAAFSLVLARSLEMAYIGVVKYRNR